MIETTCLHWKDQYIEQGKRDGEKEGERDERMAVPSFSRLRRADA